MYHINDQLLPFSEAERECKERLHGNLLLVTSPRRYLVLASVLNLQYGSYWIGGNKIVFLEKIPISFSIKTNTSCENVFLYLHYLQRHLKARLVG